MSGGELAGRVALITGAGRGIGRATAELLARAGASVLVATRSEAPGREAVGAIAAAGGRAELAAVDVATRADVASLVGRAVEAFGALDIVVHNAAVVEASAIADLADGDLDHILAVNLKAAFWFAAEAAAHLERSGAGRLLFTSSITGNRQAHPGYAAYGASKAGLNGFIRQAALEFAARGITVNGVEPGLTLTPSALAALPEPMRAAFAAMIPRGRAAEPQDVARALLFLAMPEAGHITGQTIVIDGGQSLGAGFPS